MPRTDSSASRKSVEIVVTKWEDDDYVREVLVNDRWRVYMKWDGCVEISEYDDKDVFHICDVTQFIEVLKQIEAFRLKEIPLAQ